MNRTSIEWTHRPQTGGVQGGFTWNPIRARRTMPAGGYRTGTFCTRISPGCQHCYASTINKRFGTGLEYTVPNLAEHEFYIDEHILEQPLKRKKPATIFVGDMFDLFHEEIPDAFLHQVMAVISLAQQHTFQILTKRAARMQRYWSSLTEQDNLGRHVTNNAIRLSGYQNALVDLAWPTPNLWLGVSVESQKYADERIPLLLQTPAAVRFLSVEPLPEAVSLRWKNSTPFGETHPRHLKPEADDKGRICTDEYDGLRELDWVIVGGESGPGARPFNLQWAESLRDQCKAAGVAYFLKQIGSKPGYIRKDVWVDYYTKSKGGDMSLWPEALRVREFPC